MTPTQIITLVISIGAAFSIAIFRNPLAKVGDKIIEHIGKIGNLIFNIIWFLSGFVYPLYKIFKTDDSPFDKQWVMNIVLLSLALVLNVVVFMFRDKSNMDRKQHEANRRYLDAVIHKLEVEILIARIEDLNDNGKTTAELIPKLSALRKMLHK